MMLEETAVYLATSFFFGGCLQPLTWSITDPSRCELVLHGGKRAET